VKPYDWEAEEALEEPPSRFVDWLPWIYIGAIFGGCVIYVVAS
jgi:hypothetical protein